jgi:WD40 repeat protein
MPSSNTTSNVNFRKKETFRMVQKKRMAGTAIEEGSQNLSVFTLAPDPKLLLAGTKAGGVVYWQLGETNKHGGQKKERQSHVLSSASRSPHNGMITALCYSEHEEFVRWVKDEARGLLFSGGADRLIKIWDIWTYMERGEDPLMQTLAGHTHTVTGLVDSGIEGGIISSSLDKTIKIWQPEGGRKLMLNPFFVCLKTIRVGGDETWVNSMCMRGGEDWALFCGDSEGSISVYENHGKGIINVGISKKWNNIHKLAISSVVLIPEQNFLVSCR